MRPQARTSLLNNTFCSICLCGLGASVALACAARAVPDPESPAAVTQVKHRFYDACGNSLEIFDPVWQHLSEFFQVDTPERVVVDYKPTPPSMFRPDESRVEVQVVHLPSTQSVVAHEAAHLFIYHITQGASVEEDLRFIDEGLAEVSWISTENSNWATAYHLQPSNARGGRLEEYKQLALDIAAVQLKADNLSIEKLQRWHEYKKPLGSHLAYPIGSSFSLHLIDTYGHDKLLALLRNLGETKSLEAATRAVLGIGLSAVEERWLDSLRTRTTADMAQPSVVAFSPVAGAVDVPTDIKEISATFNVNMLGNKCIDTPCGETGLCDHQARWESPKKLVIPVNGELLRDHEYRLLISTENCSLKSLKSRVGLNLPPTEWIFRTQ